MMGRTFVVMSLATMALTGIATASEYKSFKDWYAACDNLRNCSAYGFPPQDVGGAYLRLERGGAANAPIKASITTDVPEKSTFTVAFDDPSLPGLPGEKLTGEETDGSDMRRVEFPASEALIASLRKAQKIIVTRQDPPDRKLPDDEKTATISMSGAVAALLWVDEQQKRLDTETAMIRRGPKPASAVPAQPKPSVIVAAKPYTGAKPPKPDASLIAKARKQCEDDPKAKLSEADGLGSGLFIYNFTCPGSSGAYNETSVYFIVPSGQPQTARAVSFEWPVKIDGATHDGSRTAAINSFFDPKSMELHSFSKGRGIGDCGTEEKWVFDGKAFRLQDLKMMVDCKGAPADDWPSLYGADVKR